MNYSARSKQGSMLALIAAISCALVVVLIFFFMNFGRIMGNFNQQQTAIQSAALAAASDLGRVVVSTNSNGLVSLSDAAPVGSATQATDTYYLPVHGINTLIGTARLDMIIANQQGDQVMEALANQDLNGIANNALPALSAALQDSILKNPTNAPYTDINKNPITAYQDALNAYNSNHINMTSSSQLVPGSFKLTLGYLSKPTLTNIPVAQPMSYASVKSGQYSQGEVFDPVAGQFSPVNVYLSYTSIPYTGPGGTNDFMFGGIGNAVTLCDPRNYTVVPKPASYKTFTKNVTFTPDMVAFTVGAEADQIFINSQDKNQQPIHQVACAQPGCNLYHALAPGAFEVSFPDGPVPEIASMANIFSTPPAHSASYPNNADVETGSGGDYPGPPGAGSTTTSMSPTLPNGNNVYPLGSSSSPKVNATPTIWDSMKVSIYDWIRSGGVGVRVDQALAFMKSPLTGPAGARDWVVKVVGDITTITSGPQIPTGYVCAFKWAPVAGSPMQLQAQSKIITKTPGGFPIGPWPYVVAANSQFYADQLGAIGNSSVPTLTWSKCPTVEIDNVSVAGPTITATNVWDAYVRDQIRYPGPYAAYPPPSNVFDHGGSPMPDPMVVINKSGARAKDGRRLEVALSDTGGTARSEDAGGGGSGACWGRGWCGHGGCGFGSWGCHNSCGGGCHGGGGNGTVSTKGNGAPPVVGVQNDFDINSAIINPPLPVKPPYYLTYAEPYPTPYPSGPLRPVYQYNGLSVQIRFRREVKAQGSNGTSTITETGYFAEEDAYDPSY